MSMPTTTPGTPAHADGLSGTQSVHTTGNNQLRAADTRDTPCADWPRLNSANVQAPEQIDGQDGSA